MTKYPNVWHLFELIDWCEKGALSKHKDGSYVPARPLGFQSFQARFKAAWLVFRGRADALVWPGDQ